MPALVLFSSKLLEYLEFRSQDGATEYEPAIVLPLNNIPVLPTFSG